MDLSNYFYNDFNKLCLKTIGADMNTINLSVNIGNDGECVPRSSWSFEEAEILPPCNSVHSVVKKAGRD